MIHGLEIPVSVVFAYTIHPAEDSKDSELAMAILLFTVNDITDRVYMCEICFKRFLLVLVTNNINDGGGGDGNDDDDDDDLMLSKYMLKSSKYLMLQNKVYTMVFNSVH